MADWTPERLIAFRDRVADAFRQKRIRSPVHFPSDTQAAPLIEIFKDFRQGDYVFSNWRSMWHALLAGIPEEELFQMILDGRSMYIVDRPRRVFCSSIVGGILPIALGVAWSIKRQHERHDLEAAKMCEVGTLYDCPRVWVFVGDMTARTGLFWEFWQYIEGHGLPVRVVEEDNGCSTNSPTRQVWGTNVGPGMTRRRYAYRRTHPHVGLSERVNF